MSGSTIFQLLGVGLVFKMPGDPAALDDRVEGPILTAADLLHSVAVKLPPFWPDNIETWLIQSESQFRLKGVTVSQTKFDYVVQSMCSQGFGPDPHSSLRQSLWPPQESPSPDVWPYRLRRFRGHFQPPIFGGHATFSSDVKDAVSSTSWSQGMFLSPWSFP